MSPCVRGSAVSTLLCAPAGRSLGTTGRTVWFDRSDTRPDGNPGGDFANGQYKGQCRTDEYVVGVAYTGRFTAPGKNPAALLCRGVARPPDRAGHSGAGAPAARR